MGALLPNQAHYRAKDLQQLFGVGSSTLYDWIEREILPKPVKLGRTSIWIREEIDAVIEERKQARGSTI